MFEACFRKGNYQILKKFTAEVLVASPYDPLLYMMKGVVAEFKRVEYQQEPFAGVGIDVSDHQADAVSYIVSSGRRAGKSMLQQMEADRMKEALEKAKKERIGAGVAAQEEDTSVKFKKYSKEWPLGPPGHFYNSRGKMCTISEMKNHYLKSTAVWLQKQFEGKPNTKFAFKKWQEIDKEIHKRRC